jgi:hypothetical protein
MGIREMKNAESKRRRGAAKRESMNWTTAKLLFAEGRLSIGAIGRRCAIPENTLRRNAKAEGWERGRRPDFGEFGEPAENPGFSEIGSLAESGKGGIPIDPAAIADRGRDLVVRMLGELEAITSLKGELRDIIINVTKDDGDGRRRTRLLRSIGLASRVGVLKNLAVAARTLSEGAAPATGKKQEAKGKAARVAATGRFATPPVPPKLVIDNDDGRRR